VGQKINLVIVAITFLLPTNFDNFWHSRKFATRGYVHEQI